MGGAGPVVAGGDDAAYQLRESWLVPVGWQAEPLTTDEVAEASDWLLHEGSLSGSSSMGHGVGRPSITPRGEAFPDSGLIARPTNPNR